MSRKIWASLALFVFALSLTASIKDPVRTASGPVAGAPGRNTEVQVYKGIPYAAPPVGDLRWKEPQPVATWKETRQATEFGAQCTQAPYPENSLYYSPPQPTSE